MLETVRRREGWSSLALGDPRGEMLAGAGRYEECAQLCARAAAGTELPQRAIVTSAGRFALVAAADDNQSVLASAAATEKIAAACERILSDGESKGRQPLLDS